MSREEAIRLARIHLNEGQQTHFLLLDYLRILNSPTEYETCWYFDFRYHPQHFGELPDAPPSTPGFLIEKKDKQARIITWNELYNLNQTPHPF